MPEDNDPGVRYWPRLGLYVSKTDAEEYISKAGSAGAVLDDDVEEFVPAGATSQDALREELAALFEAPFERHEISNENRAILVAIQMEKNRVTRVKEMMAEGMTKEDAKAAFDQELDYFVRESLGLPDETEAEREYREKYLSNTSESGTGEEE